MFNKYIANLFKNIFNKESKQQILKEFFNSNEHFKNEMTITEFKSKFGFQTEELFIEEREQDKIYSIFQVNQKSSFGKSKNMIISYFITATNDKQYPKEFLSFFGIDFKHVDSLNVFIVKHIAHKQEFYSVGFLINEDAYHNKNRSDKNGFNFIVGKKKLEKLFSHYKPMLFEFKDKRLKIKNTLNNF